MTERVPDTIPLSEVVYVLANMKSEKFPEGILIPNDLGNHAFCSITSNCPEAVKLNRVMMEAGLEFQELLVAYNQVYRPVNPLDSFTMPEVDGRTAIVIGTQRIEIDLTEVLRNRVGTQLQDILYRMENLENTGREAIRGCYLSYVRAVRDVRQARRLEQLTIPTREYAKYPCYVSSDQGRYLFTFSFNYEPQWIYRGGERYELSTQDKGDLLQSIFLTIPVSPERSIFQPYLVDEAGRTFSHYHGTHGDCWGHVRLPTRWDGSLKQLDELKCGLEAASATINMDSLMSDNPPGFPDIRELLGSCTHLGSEGVRRTRAPRPVEEHEVYLDEDRDDGDDDDVDNEPDFIEPVRPPARGWGAARREG